VKLSHRAQAAEPFYAMAFGNRAAALEAAGHQVAKLNIGEPDFGALPAVRDAMREVMDGRPLPYTSAFGLPELRAAIAGFYRTRHGVEIDPARVIVTSGASAALLLVLAATTDPGDEVILADPSYPANRQLIEAFGARIATVPTRPETRYQLDATSVGQAWSDRTAAVLIASPSNPTGTSIPFPELTDLCQQARDRGGWRIVDEIYLNLADPAPDGTQPRTILSADPDAIVINSFSKYFGMTGWRLGWCVLPEALVPAVEKLAMSYYICASTPAQYAALECFTPG
jgi:aspartate/methionine/tyrosine aminotransferase